MRRPLLTNLLLLPMVHHLMLLHMMIRLPPSSKRPHRRRVRARPPRPCTRMREVRPKLRVQPDIIIRELTELGIVHAEDLRLFIAAQAEPGDEVHDPEDDGLTAADVSGNEEVERERERETHGHDERVAHTRGRVRELDTELSPMVVEPASRDASETVKRSYGLLREEGSTDLSTRCC